MELINKKILTTVILIVGLIALLTAILYSVAYKPSINLDNYNQEEKNNQKNQNVVSNNTNNNVGVPEKIAYGQAINVYVGKIIQFDPTCSAKPSYQVFKKGTVIMLDNRSNTDRKITLDSKIYTIKAFDYILITLTTTAQLPHVISIDCDGRQNSATINLQQ
jgi:hypothetical protein